jgi:HEAT repeat protein
MRRLWIVAASLCVLAALSPAAAGQDEPYWNSKPLSFWVAQLRDGNIAERTESASVISEIAIVHGTEHLESTIPLLVPCLDAAAPELRAAALRALEQLGPSAASAGPRLIALLHNDPTAEVRRRAGLALARILPTDPEVVAAEARALASDADAGVREAAAVGLLSAGPVAEPYAPVLRSALGDTSASVRLFAAGALSLAGDGGRGVPVLLASLTHEDPVVRAEAAGLLAEVAPAHSASVSSLVEALQDPDPIVRLAAADALGMIGPAAQPAVESLWRLIRDPNESVRESAIRAIRQIRQ